MKLKGPVTDIFLSRNGGSDGNQREKRRNDSERVGKAQTERGSGKTDHKATVVIKMRRTKTEREGVMLHWRCITSAGDITKSAVLNIEDDTFMCEAIRRDEAGPRGIGRIYGIFLFLTISPDPITSYLFQCLCAFCTAQLTSKMIALLFF